MAGCGAAAVGLSGLAGVADDVSDVTPYGEEVRFRAPSGGGALLLSTDPAPCEGSDGSGRPVDFDLLEGTFTVDAGGERFETARTFDTVEGDDYAIRCGTGAEVGSYSVVPMPNIFGGISFGALAGLILGGVFGGGLLVVLGIVFLIVGLVRRSRWKRDQAQGGPFGGGGTGTGYTPPPGPTGYAPPPGSSSYGGAPSPGTGQPGSPWTAPPPPTLPSSPRDDPWTPPPPPGPPTR
jgi:hypothetical protein